MKWFRVIRHFILGAFFLIIFYFFLSFLLLFFPQHQTNTTDTNKTKTIYIFHDIAHTEIIFPASEIIPSLQQKLQPFISNNHTGFIAFSYGDQNFMFHTPQWKDINLFITLKALFLNTPAVIRVGHYMAIRKDTSVVPLKLSKKELNALQNAILNSFTTYQNHFIYLHSPLSSYGFYYFRAKQPYNLFYTCNTWSGEMLRHTHLKVSYWTPLAREVVFHFLK